MSTLMKGWKPAWYKDEHDSSWAHVRDALKRDWEQTKHDLGLGGKELRQNIGDTVEQAAGKEPIPGGATPNAKPASTWTDAEEPMGYGYTAQSQYAKQHPAWKDAEGTLRKEWESAKHATERGWDDVKDHVRRGYEYRH